MKQFTIILCASIALFAIPAFAGSADSTIVLPRLTAMRTIQTKRQQIAKKLNASFTPDQSALQIQMKTLDRQFIAITMSTQDSVRVPK